MGIREDQIVGLNPWASDFVTPRPSKKLHYTEKIMRVYPEGKVEDTPWTDVYYDTITADSYSEFMGMFDNVYPLMKYTFLDGKVLFEVVQEKPWSSGPVIFLCLADDKGNIVPESLWPEEEMNKYL